MNQDIILVNELDEEIGYGEKIIVHKEKILHRAFSIFIFDWETKRMLLQKRAYGKYHSEGLWTNACCSHPRKYETMEKCLNTRLKEELGMNTDLHIVDLAEREFVSNDSDKIYSCGKFSYFASYGEICENEIDHVYLYSPLNGNLKTQNIEFDTNEIEEIKWVSIKELKKWIEEKPQEFTAWFKPAFELAYNILKSQSESLNGQNCFV